VASYRVVITRAAAKELESLQPPNRKRTAARIVALADDPRPEGSQKLSGRESYRVRQGDYRVLYAIDDAAKVVDVVKIAHRREAYR
jgi:mRNA interferase RelE/StbE